MTPNAHVVSLRDPVERLHSHYLMMLKNLPSMLGIMSEIQRGLALHGNRHTAFLDPDVGLCGRQIERYRREFGNRRFKAIAFEELAQYAPRTLRAISDFLGLEPVVNGAMAPAQRRYVEARGPVVRFLFGNRRLARASEALLPFRLRKYIRNTVLVQETPKPPMDPRAREFLVNFYWDDVQRPQRLLGRPLPWPSFRTEQQALRAG